MYSNKTKRRSRSVNQKNRFKKTNRRSRSEEPNRNINAEKIGEGGFGIVSRPPARCAHFFSKNSKNINQQNINSLLFQKTYYNNPKYISKLTEYNDAKKELEIGNLIKNNLKKWKNYFCFVEFICAAPDEKHIQIGPSDFQNTYAIAPYCGVTLDSILLEKYYISPYEACHIFRALKEFVYGISDLHWIQVYHNDIHSENILFSFEDHRLRLIDFGLATDLYEYKQLSGNDWRSNFTIIRAIFEDTEPLIFKIIKPTLEFIKYKLESVENPNNSIKLCLLEIENTLENIPPSYNHIQFNNIATNYNTYKNAITVSKNNYTNFLDDFMTIKKNRNNLNNNNKYNI